MSHRDQAFGLLTNVYCPQFQILDSPQMETSTTLTQTHPFQLLLLLRLEFMTTPITVPTIRPIPIHVVLSSVNAPITAPTTSPITTLRPVVFLSFMVLPLPNPTLFLSFPQSALYQRAAHLLSNASRLSILCDLSENCCKWKAHTDDV